MANYESSSHCGPSRGGVSIIELVVSMALLAAVAAAAVQLSVLAARQQRELARRQAARYEANLVLESWMAKEEGVTAGVYEVPLSEAAAGRLPGRDLPGHCGRRCRGGEPPQPANGRRRRVAQRRERTGRSCDADRVEIPGQRGSSMTTNRVGTCDRDPLPPGGVTLMEVVIVMGVLGMLMASIATLYRTLFLADATARQRLSEAVFVDRLATQFQRDVHRAAAAEIDAGVGGDETESTYELRLRAPADLDVVYRYDGQQLTRDEIVANEVVRSEPFRIPGCSAVRFALVEEAPLRVELRLEPDTRDPRRSANAQVIRAVLGLHALLVGGGEEP